MKVLLLVLLIIVALGLIYDTLGQSVSVYVSTFAGTGTSGSNNGPVSSATFDSPFGIAIDSAGNLIVAEASGRIRKISTDGQVTLMTTTSLAHYVTIDPQDNVFFTEPSNCIVKKVTPALVVTTIAGVSGSCTINDGFSTVAKFSVPYGITITPNGDLYVADNSNARIRKLSASNGYYVTTYAGTGTFTTTDGQGTYASFKNPIGISVDSLYNFYVSEFEGNTIRKISPTGYVSTLVGTGVRGSTDGQGTYALLNYPVATSKDELRQVVYVTDYVGNKICMVSPTGYMTTIAGTGTSGYLDGFGTVATFQNPSSVTLDGKGNLYVGDRFSQKIRKLTVCWTPAYYDTAIGGCNCPTGYQMASNYTCTLCPAGQELDSTKKFCTNCASLKYRDLTMRTCDYCSWGLDVSSDRTACICPSGKYKNSSNTQLCFNCPLGTESSSDRLSCSSCAAGKYRPSLTYQTCVDCPLYATCNSTHIATCQPGFKINSAGNECEACSAGTQSSTDYMTCVSCSGSTYRTATMSSCQTCPSNSSCTVTTFTCNAGYTMNTGGIGCDQCPLGYSKSAAGNGACSACSIGTESSQDRQSCVACSTGYYRSNLLLNKCIPCPAGAICSASAITRCANGFKINSGNDGCEQCQVGQHSTDGLNCVACSAGYVKPDQSYFTCIQCPSGGSCGQSIVSCQTGYYFDNNAQCKRNDTYFALQQTGTQTIPTVTSYITMRNTLTMSMAQTSTVVTTQSLSLPSVYLTAVSTNTQTVTSTVSVNNNGPVSMQTVTVSQIVSLSSSSGTSGQQQAQSANSVYIDFIGTLPVSPLILAAATFGAGLFIMLIISLICCRRKSPSRKRDNDFDGVTGMTTTMNTQSQRTFTNSSSMR